MTEPSTARPLPVEIRVNNQTYFWDCDNGVETTVVDALQAFVYREALRVKALGAVRGLSTEDLVQEGRVGVLEAAKRFDPFRGTVFITYAAFWIRRSILASLREQSLHIPAKVHDSLMRIGGLPPICSLDMETPSGESQLWETLGVSATQDDEAQAIEARTRVWSILGTLPSRHREVLSRRFGLFGEAETLEQIAATWGLSRERVRQVQRDAEAKFRARLFACAKLRKSINKTI